MTPDDSLQLELLAADFIRLTQDTRFLQAELVLLAVIVLLLLLSVLRRVYTLAVGMLATGLSGLGLMLYFVLVWQQGQQQSWQVPSRFLLDNLWLWHPLQVYARMGLALASLLILMLFLDDLLRRYRQASVEWLLWVMGALLGLDILLLSANWLVFYLSFETVSLCTYFLLAVGQHRRHAEGVLKTVLFGSFASALMLYGMSWLYALSGGKLVYAEADFFLALSNQSQLWLYLAWGLLLAGFCFKLSLVPFHFWAPDAYVVAPSMTLAWVSLIPKLGFLSVLLLLLWALQDSASLWVIRTCLMGVALLSLLWGNLAAVWQQNLKRLMAYAGIGQLGLMLLPVIVADEQAHKVMLYYWSIYGIALLLVFALLSQQQGNMLEDLHGKGRSRWLEGLVWTLAAISLIGLPPTAGLLAKLSVFIHFAPYAETHHLAYGLWVVAILTTAVALVYYIRIPYALYFRSERADVPLAYTTGTTDLLRLLMFGLLSLMLVIMLLWGVPS